MKLFKRVLVIVINASILVYLKTNLSWNSHLHISLRDRYRYLSDNSNTAIAVLVPNTDSDLFDFCLGLKSLENLPRSRENIAIVVFHEADFTKIQLETIIDCAHGHTVSFAYVDFENSFPEGFDPDERNHIHISNYGHFLGRKRWGYAQMIRFWTTRIWLHPSIQAFDTLMRMDTDSCFQKMDNITMLPFLDDAYDYQSFQNPIMEGSSSHIEGLYEFALDYMRNEKISPSYPELWEKIELLWKTRGELPVMQTNLEVGRRDFFLRPDVAKWHSALSEKEPFGVFVDRWGDAHTRVLTMAMFGSSKTVSTVSTQGYTHGRGMCQKYFNTGKNRTLDTLRGLFFPSEKAEVDFFSKI